ncbi:MAG: hypothetical protein A2Y97_03680 [Nitrospirae bacterium RBG_13_39_12]|nr:MAG: hypothetical protein A2Y97_03680 [Nitrospirae bacterium RBG_13_39_12]
MVKKVWNEMQVYYPNVEIDQFIVMPNHIHGIIVLFIRAGPCACPDKNKPDKRGQPHGVAPRTKRKGDRYIFWG